MTMPAGWPEPVAKEKEKELTEAEKKEKEEWDNIYDYYYEVVKPAYNDPNKSLEETRKILQKYYKMKEDKEAQIIARKIGIQEGKVKTLKDLEKNKVYKKHHKEFQQLEKRELNRVNKVSNNNTENAGIALLIGLVFLPFLILIAGMIVLNFTMIIIGLVLFGILMLIVGVGQAETHHSTYYFMLAANRARAFRMGAAYRATRG